MIKNIRHAGIVVNNLDKSLEFYCDILGFEVKKNQLESGKYIDLFLGLENVRVRTVKLILENQDMIELLYFHNPHKKAGQAININNIGCTHIALTVDNLQKLYDDLAGEGIEFNNPPTKSRDGKAKVAFCKDPDGTFIELVEELS